MENTGKRKWGKNTILLFIIGVHTSFYSPFLNSTKHNLEFESYQFFLLFFPFLFPFPFSSSNPLTKQSSFVLWNGLEWNVHSGFAFPFPLHKRGLPFQQKMGTHPFSKLRNKHSIPLCNHPHNNDYWSPSVGYHYHSLLPPPPLLPLSSPPQFIGVSPYGFCSNLVIVDRGIGTGLVAP